MISPIEYDAWLFDLDGVITDTASVHAAAWKRTFDGYLKEVSEREGRPFELFEINPDYYRYVHRKPRYDGVDSFLRSRGIVLEWGNPNDPPHRETVCGLGNCKNAMFNEVLRFRGVEVFGSSVVLIRELKFMGRRAAVVTSSKNCDTVLEAAGIQDLFDARVETTSLRRRSSPASLPPRPTRNRPDAQVLSGTDRRDRGRYLRGSGGPVASASSSA